MYKKKILLFFVLLIITGKKAYAAEYVISDFTNVYSWGIYSNQNCDYRFTKNLILSDKKVKMTQDDIYYTFDISAIASLNEKVKNKIVYEAKGHGYAVKGYSAHFGWNGYYKAGDDGIVPNSIGECYSLVKNRLMPVAYRKENFTDDEIEWYNDFSISNGGCVWDMYNSLYIGTEKISSMTYHHSISETWSESSRRCSYNTNEDYFFMKYPIKEIKPFYGFSLPTYNPDTEKRDLEWTADTLLKTQDGFELLSNSCSLNNYTLDEYNRVATADYIVKAKVKIKKSLFSNYRYFAFAGLNFITKFTYCNDYVSDYSGIFSSTDTIDLNEFVTCNHNWEYSDIENSTNHTMYCKNCNWTKSVAHNYKYEYDGMTNNLCECGHNKKVKYTFVINDDKTNEVTKTFDTYSNYEKIVATSKKGYTFKKYEKYETQLKNENYSTTKTEINVVKQADVNSMTDKTGNLSVKYKAIWEANKYTFVYSNINNLSISLTGTIANQSFVYDESQKVKNGQQITGYTFKGWTTVKNSDVVEFLAGDIVNNYTAINNATITLYPIYIENKYKIKYSSYNEYNKKIKEIPEQIVKYSALVKLTKAEEIKGYIFKGWSKIKDSKIVEYKNEEEVSKLKSAENDTIILYPIYEPIKYTIVYSNNNNLSISLPKTIANQSFVYDESQKVKEGQIITGYTFKGWTTVKNSNVVEFSEGISIKNCAEKNNAIVTLYPVYSENEYKIKYSSYNKYNKEIEELPVQIIKYSILTKLLKSKEIEGYIFKGWSKIKDSKTVEYKEEEEISKMSSIENDTIILYPIYEPIKYTVSYSNVNNLSITLPEVLSNQEFIYDEAQKIKKGQEVIGYRFDGWTTEEESDEVKFINGDLINNYTSKNSEIITFYPVYTENEYKIKYSSYNEYGKKINELPEQVVKYSASVKLTKAEEIEGYIFKGWSKIKGSKVVEYKNEEEISKLRSEENDIIILYPIYEPIKYIITYSNVNNLSITLPEVLSNQEFIYDNAQVIRNGQELTGYRFDGWTTEEGSNEVKFINGDLINNYTSKNSEIITFYPVYTENEYEIEYSTYNEYSKKLNKKENQKIKYSNTVNLIKAEKIKGYIFSGWTKTKNSRKVDYSDEEKISKLSYVNGDVITLYPIYKPIEYTLIYSNINNVNKEIISKIDNQKCIYDNVQKIKNGIGIERYKFLGWSLKKYSDEVEFLFNEKILNYTDKNNSEVILHPVYRINNIRINYYTTKGEYHDMENTIIQDVLYDDNEKLIFPHNYSSDESFFTYYSCSLDDTKKFEDMKSVKSFMYDKKITEITLKANFDRPAIGKAERTADGLSPMAGGGLGNGKKKIIMDDNENKKNNEKNESNENNKNNKNNENINDVKETILKELDNSINKDEKTKKNIKENDIEIFDMTKSEWQKIYEILGIKVATFSTVTGKSQYEIYGNIYMIKIALYILKYRKQILLSIVFIVLVSIVILVKKRR